MRLKLFENNKEVIWKKFQKNATVHVHNTCSFIIKAKH